MAKEYRFDVGDRVRVVLRYRSASTGVHEHNGEVMTIAARCPRLYAYEVKEYPGQLWMDGVFEKAE